MYNGKKISVVIPAYNEEDAIGSVLEAIPNGIPDEVIVVDNGSTDRTPQVALEHGARVVKEAQKGYGAACLSGIRHCTHPDIIVILDADFSDHPEEMPALLEPIAAGTADMVIGSRVLGKREKGALTPQAYWGNKLAIFMIKTLFGFTFTDMGPFRAIRSSSLAALSMTDKNFGWNAEMQIKAVRKGLTIKEIPADYRVRVGASKISGTFFGTIKAGTKIVYTIVKYAFVTGAHV